MTEIYLHILCAHYHYSLEQVIESMVTALFICYANNPDVMLLNMPELYRFSLFCFSKV
eukprot:COSAG05_NODE_2185_length_3428_cov_7.328026_1_plen_58_part_00